jgi:carbonic anhydrase/acetyltransferase-like protein (isoleucine patch superfamily)
LTSDQPVARPLPTHKYRIKADRQPCLERDSESVFEQEKIFHALERAATVIGKSVSVGHNNITG